MQAIKRHYVNGAQALAGVPALRRFAAATRDADAYGWRRWLASLFAIYDAKAMALLDCPWWNVAATREVERFLSARPGARVFEYGAGASTVWLARRAAEVTSVEHDRGWIEQFRALAAPHANVALLHRELGRDGAGYIRAIDESAGEFDLIVVDGRHRAACVVRAAPRLAPGGMILFDDSGRRRYRPAIAASGLVERHFYGRSFCVPHPDHTSLLSR